MFKKIIFWDPCVSPHKADLFAALAVQMPSTRVLCVADQGLPADRKALGWHSSDPVGYELFVAPTDDLIDALVDGSKDVLHIFSGVRHVPSIVAALRLVKQRVACFGIMSEPRVTEGVGGFLRRAQSWLTEGWLRRNVAFVLAIGRNGPPWFLSVGYPAQRVFPFAYFVNAVDIDAPPMRSEKSALTRIGFVGRITQSKGADAVVDAASLCPNSYLTMVGAGDLLEVLRLRCVKSGLKVDFLGSKSISEIPEVMRQLDVLVLASNTTDDGWGVVVSEALLAGTAVIATDCVGASVLLDQQVFGECVSSNSPQVIAAAIESLRSAGAFSEEARALRKARARVILTGVAGAIAFEDIVNYCFSGALRPSPFYTAQSRAQ